MDDQGIYTIFIKRSSWVWHLVYWLLAALLMYFIFSNRNYDVQIRLVLVSLLIVVAYLISLSINKYLIPKFLFKGKLFLFSYSLFFVFILTLWIISLTVFAILLYSAYTMPHSVVPKRDDLVILIAGNYLVVVMAAVIHFIKESYRRLIEKNELEKQKQLTEIKLKEANLKLLQGQIHPHFLFNMLNNLYGLVNENADVSRDMIVKLSNLLDYMLYECDKPVVELKREIEFITNYIELERVRHDENFNVQTRFPADLEGVKIAPLIIFPFIENAFKHGFHNPEDSTIRMEMDLVEAKLKFKIENSVSEVNPDTYLKQEGKGIGLKNIQDRLELIYKDKYRLDIVSDDNRFKISLEIENTEPV